MIVNPRRAPGHRVSRFSTEPTQEQRGTTASAALPILAHGDQCGVKSRSVIYFILLNPEALSTLLSITILSTFIHSRLSLCEQFRTASVF